MNKTRLLENWLNEEKSAYIHEWDFTHIMGRYQVENCLSWDYETIICNYLKTEMKLLDIDTGGGEFSAVSESSVLKYSGYRSFST